MIVWIASYYDITVHVCPFYGFYLEAILKCLVDRYAAIFSLQKTPSALIQVALFLLF